MTHLFSFLAGLAALLVPNMLLFPIVFGDGVPLPYSGLRSEPLLMFNFVALCFTVALIEGLCVVTSSTVITRAALVGALSGLLASVPTAFHTYSAVDIDAMSQVAPIVWTAATWAACGAAIAYVARQRRAA